jgi:hypothetical protein
VFAEDWGSETCTHAVGGLAGGAELSVTLEILRSSLDSKSDVGARGYGSSKSFARSTTLWPTTVLMDKEKEVWMQPKLLLGF